MTTQLRSYPSAVWSEILPGLWQGGTADNDTVHELHPGAVAVTTADFDFVVTLYVHARPVGSGVMELRYGFPDDHTSALDEGTLYELASAAHAAWETGKRVLVRCQAGLNRSGLIMALVLMREGFTARGAIDLIRDGRSESALFNTRFVSWLHDQSPVDSADIML